LRVKYESALSEVCRRYDVYAMVKRAEASRAKANQKEFTRGSIGEILDVRAVYFAG
jgi:hypothetical protein